MDLPHLILVDMGLFGIAYIWLFSSSFFPNQKSRTYAFLDFHSRHARYGSILFLAKEPQRKVMNCCLVVWCTQNVRRDGSSFTWHQTRND